MHAGRSGSIVTRCAIAASTARCPRRNWRKLDERLDFSRLFTPVSPQRHSREQDTARRLLPFRSPCKTHDGKTSGDSAKVFVASVFDARRIADELSVPFLWQCCDTGNQPDWVEETLEDSAVTFRFPKSQNTGLDTASHFGRGMFVPRLSKCRPERYIRRTSAAGAGSASVTCSTVTLDRYFRPLL